MPLMTLREYSRHRGVSLSSVQYAIKSGRISTVEENGKKLVDSAAADTGWEANTDPRKRNRGEFRKKIEAGEDTQAPAGPKRPSLADAILHEKVAKAEFARLELQEKQGKLVRADAVREEAFRLGRQLRETILNVPARVAAMIRAAPDDQTAYQILELELRKALEGLPNE